MFLNTLPAQARQLFKSLGQEPLADSFYLAGGSALALHLGHRVSVDLDFFTSEHYESESLFQQLQAIGKLNIHQQSQGTMIGKLNDVRISFFTYPYSLLEEFVEIDGVRIATLLDIALMKLIAIAQRGAKRDFVDLYFICQHGYSLKYLLTRLSEKYPEVPYPSSHLLRALTYFDDADADISPQVLVPYDWSQVKQFFQTEVPILIKKFFQS